MANNDTNGTAAETSQKEDIQNSMKTVLDTMAQLQQTIRLQNEMLMAVMNGKSVSTK